MWALVASIPAAAARAPAFTAPVRLGFQHGDDWEPAIALFAASQGMAIAAHLVREGADALAPAGVLALEVDVSRAGTVAQIAASIGSYEDVQVLLDLTGRERFVVARRREEQE